MNALAPPKRSLREQRRLSERPWRALTGARIRAARTTLGLRQDQFAVLIGRTEGRGIAPDYRHVGRWERGERTPGALWGPSLLRICEHAEKLGNEQKGAGPR